MGRAPLLRLSRVSIPWDSLRSGVLRLNGWFMNPQFCFKLSLSVSEKSLIRAHLGLGTAYPGNSQVSTLKKGEVSAQLTSLSLLVRIRLF